MTDLKYHLRYRVCQGCPWCHKVFDTEEELRRYLDVLDGTTFYGPGFEWHAVEGREIPK